MLEEGEDYVNTVVACKSRICGNILCGQDSVHVEGGAHHSEGQIREVLHVLYILVTYSICIMSDRSYGETWKCQ